jgi:hypothetical protein
MQSPTERSSHWPRVGGEAFRPDDVVHESAEGQVLTDGRRVAHHQVGDAQAAERLTSRERLHLAR